MYPLKQILVKQNIELPTCMYQMKPIITRDGEGMQDNSKNSSVCNIFLPHFSLLKNL
jgi:hypothetical protein